MTDVLSEPPKIAGMNACTDAALMQAAGTPAPLIGATGGNYDAPGEWLSVPDFMKLCAILQPLAVADMPYGDKLCEILRITKVPCYLMTMRRQLRDEQNCLICNCGWRWRVGLGA